ncbi:MAG: flagellar biosynthesis protein FlhF [Gammaproteobacteria bacterium]
MKVKRFIADDMRTALREVKEELGPDAVILSNRSTDGQVELLAAMNYDEALINDALNQTLNKAKPGSAAAYYEQAAAERYAGQDEEQPAIAEIDQHYPGQEDKAYRAAAMNVAMEHQASGLLDSRVSENHGLSEMKQELKSLRATIENQHAMTEWGQMTQQHPLRISLYRRFTEMGLSQDVCKYLVKGLDESSDFEKAMQAALKQLVHQLPVADDDILDRGGVIAMVGPTGVGKTTTIAKLAARFAMRHGQRHVALISTDNYRIGAHEQLMTFGRLLSVPVYTANDAKELQQHLHKLNDKKLVLIDTAGMSQRDLRLSEQFVHIGRQAALIKSYLVLSANAQLTTLDEVIRSFKKANLAGCILTKTDEAVSLGGVLSAMIKHHLPAAYVSDGQRVPEDLKPARAREMVNEALAHMKRYREASDEEFLAMAFHSDVSHAHL